MPRSEKVSSLGFRRIVLRDGYPGNVDPTKLRVHPAIRQDPVFQEICSEAAVMYRWKYKRLMKARQGLDSRDVMVDIETFRFRDVFVQFWKNLGQPIPKNDEFLLKVAFYLGLYLAWKLFKWLGKFYFHKQVEQHKQRKSNEELAVEDRRVKEDQMNNQLAQASKSPQRLYRFDFKQAEKEVEVWNKQVAEVFK